MSSERDTETQANGLLRAKYGRAQNGGSNGSAVEMVPIEVSFADNDAARCESRRQRC